MQEKTARPLKNLAALIALLAAVLLLSLAVHADCSVGFWGDQDWELLVARMWLHGKKLYIDHVPVTAPLLFYIYALPVWLSERLPSLQDFQALVLLSLGGIALAMAVSTRLIALHPGFESRARRLQWIVLLAFLLIFRITPPFFGDREHIMLVLTLPYLLRWLPALSDKPLSLRLRLAVGTMAAVGFFIKPHCLLAFAAIQLVSVLRMRSLRIVVSAENLVIYGLGALYGLIVWLYTPEYLTLVLPIAWFTYSAIQGSPGGMYELMVTIALTFILMSPRDRSPYHRDIGYLLALLPFYYLYARINNGWAYSYQPLMTVLLLANGFALWQFLYLRRQHARAWRPIAGVVLCLLNFALETGLPLHYYRDAEALPCRGDAACPGYYQPFLDEMKTAPAAHSFGAIGLDFALWTRVAKLSGADWVTRFPQLWMLPKLYIADDNFYQAHIGIFYYVAGALAQDLQKNKPDIVFVEVSSTMYAIRMNKPINWVEDLSLYPDFKDAWEHYRLSRSIDDCSQLVPEEAVVLQQPKGPGPQPKLARSNCHYDVYRRIP